MKTTEELRREWDQFVNAGGLCHTMAGASVHSYGTHMWKEEQFAQYVQGERAMEHYSDLKKHADSSCPSCRGRGYSPVFMPGSPYAQTCHCVRWVEPVRG